jgi:acetyl esterase/lipase
LPLSAPRASTGTPQPPDDTTPVSPAAPAKTTTHPPLDPELAAVLTLVHEHLPASVSPADIGALRANPMFAVAEETLRRDGTVEMRNLCVPGPPGAPEIPLLVLRPVGLPTGAPVFYYMHGGGMIIGDRRTGVDGVLDWAVDNGAARARPGGPRLLGQVLMCPMLDDRLATPSSRELDGEGIWDATSNMTGWEALLGERRGGGDVSMYAAPARATDLAGLPAAFVDVGSVETFRDEDIDYATRLLQAGVQCELHVWPGGFHGFTGMVPDAALSKAATAAQQTWLRRILAG